MNSTEPEAGVEPATPRLRIVCSAKLSYSGDRSIVATWMWALARSNAGSDLGGHIGEPEERILDDQPDVEVRLVGERFSRLLDHVHGSPPPPRAPLSGVKNQNY